VRSSSYIATNVPKPVSNAGLVFIAIKHKSSFVIITHSAFNIAARAKILAGRRSSELKALRAVTPLTVRKIIGSEGPFAIVASTAA